MLKKQKTTKPGRAKRIIVTLLIIALVLTNVVTLGLYVVMPKVVGGLEMEGYMQAQIVPLVQTLPGKILSYPFKAKSNSGVTTALEKSGGFLKGICHPHGEFDLITAANIGWERADVPFPYEKDGVTLRKHYLAWKAEKQAYVDHGIKIFMVTPYPSEFLEYGVDPRVPAGETRMKEIIRFLVEDLRDIIGAVQISNELGVPRFSEPLTAEQCVRFMGESLKALSDIKGDIIVGYNSAGPQADQHLAMKPYWSYCDYIGLDIYAGCFDLGVDIMNAIQIYDLVPAYLWSLTGKPIILTEFGYISKGAEKTEEERLALLQTLGYESEDAAKADWDNFKKKLTPSLAERCEREGKGQPGNFLFSPSGARQHFYRELSGKTRLKDYAHTAQGQADFYAYMIPRLAKRPYIIGEFIYSWADAKSCYYCGYEDCPVETGWGLVDLNGNPQPSYDAVQKAFGAIQ
jgi:hypothetical protein